MFDLFISILLILLSIVLFFKLSYDLDELQVRLNRLKGEALVLKDSIRLLEKRVE